eukprot:3526988-Prymnesium_polylepis.1
MLTGGAAVRAQVASSSRRRHPSSNRRPRRSRPLLSVAQPVSLLLPTSRRTRSIRVAPPRPDSGH